MIGYAVCVIITVAVLTAFELRDWRVPDNYAFFKKLQVGGAVRSVNDFINADPSDFTKNSAVFKKAQDISALIEIKSELRDVSKRGLEKAPKLTVHKVEVVLSPLKKPTKPIKKLIGTSTESIAQIDGEGGILIKVPVLSKSEFANVGLPDGAEHQYKLFFDITASEEGYKRKLSWVVTWGEFKILGGGAA